MTTEHSGDRLRRTMQKKDMSPTTVAAALKITTQTLNNWFSRGVPGRSLFHVAALLGVNMEWLQDGVGPETWPPERLVPIEKTEPNAMMLGQVDVWDDSTPLHDDEVCVPFLKEVELSAGRGRTAVQESSNRKLRFGRISLRNKGVDPSNAKCVTVAGNSMEPVLRNGATVAVDTGNTRIIDGDMFAIDHAGQLRVKQVYRLPGGGIRLRSFNRDEHPDEEYTTQQVQDQEIVVLGRVFWSGGYH